MAIQQYGYGTNNYQISILPDGSILSTTDECLSTGETLEYFIDGTGLGNKFIGIRDGAYWMAAPFDSVKSIMGVPW